MTPPADPVATNVEIDAEALRAGVRAGMRVRLAMLGVLVLIALVLLAEAAHNTLITEMTTAIRHSMRSMVLASFHEHGDWPHLSDQLRQQHRVIYDAIVAQDSQRAADAVEEHLRSANAVLGWGAAN